VASTQPGNELLVGIGLLRRCLILASSVAAGHSGALVAGLSPD